jgi:hypothetical protein
MIGEVNGGCGASEAMGDVSGASEAMGDVSGASEATGDVSGASEATGDVSGAGTRDAVMVGLQQWGERRGICWRVADAFMIARREDTLVHP